MMHLFRVGSSESNLKAYLLGRLLDTYFEVYIYCMHILIKQC